MLYAIADLHLSIGTENKEMDIFGENWRNHTRKLEQNWNNVVTDSDTVVIAGDVCWATGMENARADLEFIHNLPGQKIILKGNHDYWWNTVTKLDNFTRECGFHTLRFLHNDAMVVEDKIICGTRGWLLEENPNNADNFKIFEREKIRLELSLQKAQQLLRSNDVRPYDDKTVNPVKLYDVQPTEIIVFMHYPPVTRYSENAEFLELMQKSEVKRCFYGHLHGMAHKTAVIGEVCGIDLQLISCDYTDFTPMLLDKA